MKNKRKHTEQTDKAEELAKRKLTKLSKVMLLSVYRVATVYYVISTSGELESKGRGKKKTVKKRSG